MLQSIRKAIFCYHKNKNWNYYKKKCILYNKKSNYPNRNIEVII